MIDTLYYKYYGRHNCLIISVFEAPSATKKTKAATKKTCICYKKDVYLLQKRRQIHFLYNVSATKKTCCYKKDVSYGSSR